MLHKKQFHVKSLNNTHKYPIGALGEAIAAKHFAGRGFKVIERNYRKTWGEIDLILEKEGTVHFIEVKTVQNKNRSVNPEENLHPAKIKRILRAVESYLGERGVRGNWQIDAALVLLDLEGKRAEVEILEHIGF